MYNFPALKQASELAYKELALFRKAISKPKMSDHVERVVKELGELNAKIDALMKFILTETFESLTKHHQDLLIAQYHAMLSYSRILDMRLDLFKQEKMEQK